MTHKGHFLIIPDEQGSSLRNYLRKALSSKFLVLMFLFHYGDSLNRDLNIFTCNVLRGKAVSATAQESLERITGRFFSGMDFMEAC